MRCLLGEDLADPEALEELDEGEEDFFENPPDDVLAEEGALGGSPAAEAQDPPPPLSPIWLEVFDFRSPPGPPGFQLRIVFKISIVSAAVAAALKTVTAPDWLIWLTGWLLFLQLFLRRFKHELLC